ncbi:hypothetical protein [Pseudonocardia sp. N23]
MAGGAGDDTVSGGAGADRLRGGAARTGCPEVRVAATRRR